MDDRRITEKRRQKAMPWRDANPRCQYLTSLRPLLLRYYAAVLNGGINTQYFNICPLISYNMYCVLELNTKDLQIYCKRFTEILLLLLLLVTKIDQ
jgi:hypothetical protein